jgi:hypothetical protein
MIRICTLANRLNGPNLSSYLALERSIIKAGLTLYTYIETTPWRWERKVDWELECVEAHPDDTFVFIDTFDFLFVGEKDELVSVLERQPLLFSTDGGVVPWPYPHYADAYDKRRIATSSWRWVNGSGPAGKGSTIAEAIRYGKQHFELFDRETDQIFWSNVYLDGWGDLDQDCKLTQALYHVEHDDLGIVSGRFKNLKTGSNPQFIHASAQSWFMIPSELIPSEEEVKP